VICAEENAIHCDIGLDSLFLVCAKEQIMIEKINRKTNNNRHMILSQFIQVKYKELTRSK
jgi:hypothetical protein